MIESIYIVNRKGDDDDRYIQRLIQNKIYLSVNGDTSDWVLCADPINTGTQECGTPMVAQYIFIESNGSQANVINLRELRVFGTKNLTKTASVYKYTESSSSDYVVENLLSNIDNRSTDIWVNSYDRAGNEIAGTYYCWFVTIQDLNANNGLFELTLEL